MIRACVAEGKTWLGDWSFKVLPRVGERIILPPNRYQVTEIEHWPVTRTSSKESGPEIGLRIRVKSLPDF